MAETVLATVRFSGNADANGTFAPPDQAYTVTFEAPFGVAVLTIQGARSGRTHSTDFFTSQVNGPIGSYFSGQAFVPDGPRTLASIWGTFARMPKLKPSVSYLLGVRSYGYDPGEAVVITVELLALETDLPQIAQRVLADAEANDATTAVSFGMSEASFAMLMVGVSYAGVPRIEVGSMTYLSVEVTTPERVSARYGPVAEIDVSAEEIVITGEIVLVFSPTADRNIISAEVVCVIRIRCAPAMVTTAKNHLEVQFRSAEIVPNSVGIQVLRESDVLAGYPTLDAFRDDVENTLNAIAKPSGKFAFVLPAYLASRPMPNHWNRTGNVEFTFQRFDYRTITTHGIQIGYVFLVFSVRSLGVPVPCFCDGDRRTTLPPPGQPPALDAGAAANGLLVRRSRYIDPIPLPQLEEHERPQVPYSSVSNARYKPIFIAAQIMAIAVSRKSFREVARGLVDIGDIKSDEKGGAVYAWFKFWYKATLQDATIEPDGVSAVVDVTAEGQAGASVRDRCGNDVASVSVKLGIRVEDTSLRWAIGIEESRDPSGQGMLVKIVLTPRITVGQIRIDFDGVLDPPRPLDEVDDWILTTIANLFRPSLNQLANKNARVEVTESSGAGADVRISFVEDYYLQDQAIVLAALLFIPIG